ncbi:unnamed protein product [Vitrella brassicaformis CCMP3155]|uniref:Uncharacterized protein n=1 Tax=Vitrella brassicaformis (strain CCMP3155) TaxID=1169540 RepID=A0A0G4ES80_VITBC|nr:unnamed protein product [Vitrella brassicaformis CCMP3155]|eukprot:CEM00526.1 unnamed protein product [Vitrella brassicaformis CCMP3155]
MPQRRLRLKLVARTDQWQLNQVVENDDEVRKWWYNQCEATRCPVEFLDMLTSLMNDNDNDNAEAQLSPTQHRSQDPGGQAGAEGVVGEERRHERPVDGAITFHRLSAKVRAPRLTAFPAGRLSLIKVMMAAYGGLQLILVNIAPRLRGLDGSKMLWSLDDFPVDVARGGTLVTGLPATATDARVRQRFERRLGEELYMSGWHPLVCHFKSDKDDWSDKKCVSLGGDMRCCVLALQLLELGMTCRLHQPPRGANVAHSLLPRRQDTHAQGGRSHLEQRVGTTTRPLFMRLAWVAAKDGLKEKVAEAAGRDVARLGFEGFISHARVDQETIDAWLSSQPCVLLIDELNQFVRPDRDSSEYQELGKYLKSTFLLRKNRYFLFTTHVAATSSSLNHFLASDSNRPVLQPQLPVIDEQDLGRMRSLLRAKPGEICWAGRSPGLICDWRRTKEPLDAKVELPWGSPTAKDPDAAVDLFRAANELEETLKLKGVMVPDAEGKQQGIYIDEARGTVGAGHGYGRRDEGRGLHQDGGVRGGPARQAAQLGHLDDMGKEQLKQKWRSFDMLCTLSWSRHHERYFIKAGPVLTDNIRQRVGSLLQDRQHEPALSTWLPHTINVLGDMAYRITSPAAEARGADCF